MTDKTPESAFEELAEYSHKINPADDDYAEDDVELKGAKELFELYRCAHAGENQFLPNVAFQAAFDTAKLMKGKVEAMMLSPISNAYTKKTSAEIADMLAVAYGIAANEGISTKAYDTDATNIMVMVNDKLPSSHPLKARLFH